MSFPARRSAPFSRRLEWSGAENALATAEARRRATDGNVLDLTVSNPTAVGLLDEAAGAAVAAALARAPARYAPSARGDQRAREAIAATYPAAGSPVDAGRILLTASSSESYSFLWKLLCDPGDAVLVPQPSYPLFDYLARLEGVTTAPYRLLHDGSATGCWEPNLASVDAALTPAARALVIVSPNNPTGSVLRAGDLAALDARGAAAGVALVADEVFADYATTGAERIPTLAAEKTAALTFSLGGLSKSCGLPHLKLGWIVVGGPASAAEAALARLELIADTYLSVGGPVQAALPELLAVGASIRAGIAARVARNRRQLQNRARAGSPVTVLDADGGWTAILRVPALRSDEEWALTLIEDDGVLVHPGYFFDLDGATFLVISLLPTPEVFDEGAARLLGRVAAVAG